MNFNKLISVIFLLTLTGCALMPHSGDENVSYFIHKTKPISIEVNTLGWEDWQIQTLQTSFSAWKTAQCDDVIVLKKSNDPMRKTCRIGMVLVPDKGVEVECQMATPQPINGSMFRRYIYSGSFDNLDNLAGMAENPSLYFTKYRNE